jgi:transposase
MVIGGMETAQKMLTPEEMAKQLAARDARIMQLEFQLAEFQRLVYGTRSERFKPAVDPQQLTLDLGEAMEAAREEVKKEKVAYERSKPSGPKAPPSRMPLPALLPRVVVELEPEGDTDGLACIGTEVTEELECTPSTLFVRRYERRKYAQPQPDGGTRVLVAQLPSRPIDKGIAGPMLLATILVEKFLYHMPVYRQLQRFKSMGVTIPDSTIHDWIALVCHLMEPLYELLVAKALGAGYMQADETPLPVLDRDKAGSTHRGYLWAYHAVRLGLAFFDYRRTRGKAGPMCILANYRGWLQVDGYAAYEEFELREGVSLVACMAHIRRKFEHALAYDKSNASHMLGLVRELYAIERTAREGGMDAAARLKLRTAKAAPIMREAKEWLLANYAAFLPKSPMREACAYFMGRLKYMERYLTDGELEIDNNPIENLIRPVALGRKNYLFAGSHEGAKRLAMAYSFFATCKLNGIDPLKWLHAVLQRMPDHPVNRLDELLPRQKNWPGLYAV